MIRLVDHLFLGLTLLTFRPDGLSSLTLDITRFHYVRAEFGSCRLLLYFMNVVFELLNV
jgi:hypothetical protein